MHGRKMTAGDLDQVKALARAQGLELEDLPDFGSNVLVKRVVEDVPGQIICAAVARVEVMAHLYFNRQWDTPRMRLEAFRLLHEQAVRELAEKGIEHVHAELAPAIERAFSRRLAPFGWKRPSLAQLILRI